MICSVLQSDENYIFIFEGAINREAGMKLNNFALDKFILCRPAGSKSLKFLRGPK